MKQELSDAIVDYQRFRSSQDYSKATLRAEQMILKRFLTMNGNIWVHAITERHVNVHFEAASKTRGAASLQQDHSVLIAFFEWARKTGRMPSESDPMYGRRMAKPVRRERNRIPAEDFPRLLDVAEARDLRDRALAIGERLQVLADYPTAPGCTSPFAPIWITEIVRRREG